MPQEYAVLQLTNDHVQLSIVVDDHPQQLHIPDPDGPGLRQLPLPYWSDLHHNQRLPHVPPALRHQHMPGDVRHRIGQQATA